MEMKAPRKTSKSQSSYDDRLETWLQDTRSISSQPFPTQTYLDELAKESDYLSKVPADWEKLFDFDLGLSIRQIRDHLRNGRASAARQASEKLWESTNRQLDLQLKLRMKPASQ